MSKKQPKLSEMNSSILSGPMAFLRRLTIISALTMVAAPNIQAQTSSPALTQAAEQNDTFKVMSELIKTLGKDYQYAGKQTDGKVIQCAQDKSKAKARATVEQRIKSITGKDFEIKFVEVQLADGNWVIAGITEKKKETKKESMPKENVFDVMGKLIKNFGSQYQYAGKQTDGSVIQCAQGKSKTEAEAQAKKRALSLIGGNVDTTVKSQQMSDGTWVVAVLVMEGQKRKGPRGVKNAEVATIEIGATSGGKEVKIKEKKEEKLVPIIELPTLDEGVRIEQAGSGEVQKIRSELVRIVAMCQTKTLKNYDDLVGKAVIKFVIGDSGKIKLITLTGGKNTKGWTYFKKCLIERAKTSKISVSNATIDLPVDMIVK